MEGFKLVLAVLSAIGGIIVFLWGVFEFSQDSQRRSYAAAFEARKPFLTKQMDICIDASETAAILASSRNSQTWEEARERFWVHYWGPLSIVETPLEGGQIGPVEQKMVEIGKIVKEVENNPQLPVSEIEQPAFELAHNCRDLILQSWRITR